MALFTFYKGRIRRKDYWIYKFLLFLIANIINILSNDIFYIPISIIVAISLIGVEIRRMHDVNKSGWVCLIPIYSFILSLLPGTIGSNKYGKDPRWYCKYCKKTNGDNVIYCQKCGKKDE